ncbi:MAG: HYR domain-containing protein [Thermoproteota archaeon]|nr:HYR domain-containing protein [Thermoproteota archaeon]
MQKIVITNNICEEAPFILRRILIFSQMRRNRVLTVLIETPRVIAVMMVAAILATSSFILNIGVAEATHDSSASVQVVGTLYGTFYCPPMGQPPGATGNFDGKGHFAASTNPDSYGNYGGFQFDNDVGRYQFIFVFLGDGIDNVPTISSSAFELAGIVDEGIHCWWPQTGHSYTITGGCSVDNKPVNVNVQVSSGAHGTFTGIVECHPAAPANPPQDTTPPTIQSTSPSNGDIDVPITSPITAKFSEPVQGVDANSFKVNNGAVLGEVTYDSELQTAKFTPSPSLSYNTKYTASLSSTIKDSAGNALAETSWSFTTIKSPNQPPKANAGADQTVNEGDTVTLDGSGSSDPDGDTLTYSWTQTAGTTATLNDASSSTLSFTAPDVAEQGDTLTFELKVTDDNGATATDTVDVKITNVVVNNPPTANAGADQTVNEGDTVTLDGSGSSDLDAGNTLTYSWTQTAGQTVSLSSSTSAKPSFTAPSVQAEESLTFELKVDDGQGGTSTDTVNVIVQNVNGVPTASLTATPSEINEGETSALDASGSTDPDGDTLTYTFTILNDGLGTITGQSDANDATVTYQAPQNVNSDQTVTVQVEVNDGVDGSGISTKTADIIVKNIPDTTPPIVTVPSDITQEATSSEGAVVEFVATAQDDVDGSLTPDCIPASGSTFEIGETTVDCTATDAAGNTGRASFKVTVTPQPDTTAPVITVPADMTVEATSSEGAVVEYEASAEDDRDGSVDVICKPASGSTFEIGQTTVTCTAEDEAGNSAEETFTVTVEQARDTTSPNVDIVRAVDKKGAEIREGSTTNSQYIRITFDATDAVGVDETECSIDGKAFTSCTSPVVYDKLSKGSHTVTVRATDAAGNTGEDKFTWTVGTQSKK